MSDDRKVVGITRDQYIPGTVDKNLVGICESLLAQAKSGELVSIYATGFTVTDTRWQAIYGPDDPYSVIGILHYLMRAVTIDEGYNTPAFNGGDQDS